MTRPSQSRRLRVAVLGYIVRGPLGGLSWHHLQYVLGLRRMGHEVRFLEDSDDYPSCYDPVRNVTDEDPTFGLDYTERVFARLGLAGVWAYFDAHTNRWLGPLGDGAPKWAGRADVLLNLSGVNPLREWSANVPLRVLVDTDPVFTQIRHLTDRPSRARAEGHNAFFTFGASIGSPDCGIPDDGFPWMATRQPVVLEAWPVSPGPRDGSFTTVMQWESYPAREHDGRSYGMKAASFDAIVDLPGETSQSLELALGSPTAPRADLAARGWQLRDSREPTADPWTYQDYLRSSKGELSVAKHGYVVSRSGWFSERSTSYLACGRPVVVEDTGFGTWLPTGAGVVGFSSREEALEGLDQVDRRYGFHCRSARELVREHFEAGAVLADLLERAAGAVRSGSSPGIGHS